MISLVTSVYPVHDIHITNLLPHWLEVFKNQIDEILIIVDHELPRERYFTQHDREYRTPSEMMDFMLHLASLDPRIRIVEYDEAKMAREIARTWFKFGIPVRRAASSFSIIPFLCGINLASGSIVLKIDCDMSFYEAGWLAAAVDALNSGKWDLLEPARGFQNAGASYEGISARAFLLHKALFFRTLSADVPSHAGSATNRTQANHQPKSLARP